MYKRPLGCHPHEDAACHGKGQLLFEKVVLVAVVVLGNDAAGRQNHDKANAQDHDKQHKEPPVYAALRRDFCLRLTWACTLRDILLRVMAFDLNFLCGRIHFGRDGIGHMRGCFPDCRRICHCRMGMRLLGNRLMSYGLLGHCPCCHCLLAQAAKLRAHALHGPDAIGWHWSWPARQWIVLCRKKRGLKGLVLALAQGIAHILHFPAFPGGPG